MCELHVSVSVLYPVFQRSDSDFTAASGVACRLEVSGLAAVFSVLRVSLDSGAGRLLGYVLVQSV